MRKHTSEKRQQATGWSLVCLLLVLTLYLGPSLASAQTYTTHRTVPGPSSALSVYQQFMIHEDAERFADVFYSMVLGTGCRHGTSGTATSPALACQGYVQGHYINQAAATVTYSSGDNTYWLALHSDTTTAVTGWTREAGTHFLWIVSVSKPTVPDTLHLIGQATVAGGAITAAASYATRVINTATTVTGTQDWHGRTMFQPGGMITVSTGQTLTLHTCPDARSSQQIFNADAVTTGSVVLNCDSIWVDWYGVLGDDNTDGAVPFEAICTSLATLDTLYEKPRRVRFRDGATYRLGNISCDMPDGVPNASYTVDLGSSLIKPTQSGILFDFNPDGDCTTTPNYTNALRFFRLEGNSAVIDGDAVTGLLNVTALKIYVTRDVRVRGIFFRDLELAVQGCFQDNVLFEYNRFLGNTNSVVMLNSLGVGTGGNGFTTSQFLRNTFNLVLDVSETAIKIEGAVSVLFMNNTYAGKGVAGFCRVHLNNTHTIQSSQGISFIREHHEALPNTSRYLCLDDTGGHGYDGLVISGGHYEFPADCDNDCLVARVENVDGMIAEGMAISCVTGTDMVVFSLAEGARDVQIGPMDVDPQCTQVIWDGTITREDITITPVIVNLDPLQIEEDSTGTNYFDCATALSDMTVTMDMSRMANMGSLMPNPVPKKWHMRILMRDSGSAGSGAGPTFPRPSIRAHTDATALNLGDYFICGVNGTGDDSWVACQGSVTPDANGDFEVIVDATGAGTMDACIWVPGYEQ